MTVTIDPSEVRGRSAVRRSLPVRALTVGALGSVGLFAFTYGAFSFFSGLADNRVRPPRPATVAAADMPDLKDGLPALAPESGPAPKPTVLNLPKPPTPEPAPAAVAALPEVKPADLKPADVAQTALRTDTAVPAVAEPPRVDEATGSVERPPAKLGKAAPVIENAATVAASAKQQAAVIGPAKLSSPLAPAKTETVRAKPVESRTAAIAAPPPAPVSTEAEAPASKRAAAKPVKAKVARASAAGDQASAEPASPPPPKADDEDGLGSKLQSGMKALGGMFGDDE